MAEYLLKTTIASNYIMEQGWQYENPALESKEYSSAIECSKSYDAALGNLIMLASTHQAAARLEMIRKDGVTEEVIRQNVYEGEDVYFWYAAVQEKGLSVFEDRWYITRIYKPVGYYALMHAGNQYPDTKTVACSQSLYDLKEQLGEEAGIYELKT